MNQPVSSAAGRRPRLAVWLAGVVMLTVAGSVMMVSGASAAATPEPEAPIAIVCPPDLPGRPYPVCPLPDPCPLVLTPDGEIIHLCPPPCPPYALAPTDLSRPPGAEGPAPSRIYCPPPEL